MHISRCSTDQVSFTWACTCFNCMYCALLYRSSSHRRSSRRAAGGATVVITVQLVQLLLVLLTEGTLLYTVKADLHLSSCELPHSTMHATPRELYAEVQHCAEGCGQYAVALYSAALLLQLYRPEGLCTALCYCLGSNEASTLYSMCAQCCSAFNAAHHAGVVSVMGKTVAAAALRPSALHKIA
eukprot:20317-Heterococcus_DN1.PRE.2